MGGEWIERGKWKTFDTWSPYQPSPEKQNQEELYIHIHTCMLTYIYICTYKYAHIYIYTYIHKDICFKELAYMLVEVGQPKICRAGQQAGIHQSGAELRP